jgi:hypothetical protein
VGYLIFNLRWTLRRPSSSVLVLRSSLLVELVTLFSSGFVAHFDQTRRLLHLTSRRWWRTTRRVVSFDEISYIDRDVVEVRVGSEHSLRSQPRLRVTLFLQLLPSGEKIELAHFFDDERSQILIGGRAWELLGDELARATAKPFGLHARIAARIEGSTHCCERCGRPSPVQRTTCLYCGGGIVKQGEQP